MPTLTPELREKIRDTLNRLTPEAQEAERQQAHAAAEHELERQLAPVVGRRLRGQPLQRFEPDERGLTAAASVVKASRGLYRNESIGAVLERMNADIEHYERAAQALESDEGQAGRIFEKVRGLPVPERARFMQALRNAGRWSSGHVEDPQTGERLKPHAKARGFLGALAEDWNRGTRDIEQAIESVADAVGMAGSQEAKDWRLFEHQLRGTRQASDPTAYKGTSFGASMSQAWQGFVRMAPSLAATAVTGGVGGMAAKGIGLGAKGATLAQAAAQGAKALNLGGKLGQTAFWGAREAGPLFDELRAGGLDDDSAALIALPAGLLSGMVEMIAPDIRYFTGGVRQEAKRAASFAVRQEFLRVIRERGIQTVKDFSKEMLEEVLQGGLNVAAKALANKLPEGTDFDIQREMQAQIDQLREAGLTVGMMQILGGGVQLATNNLRGQDAAPGAPVIDGLPDITSAPEDSAGGPGADIEDQIVQTLEEAKKAPAVPDEFARDVATLPEVEEDAELTAPGEGVPDEFVMAARGANIAPGTPAFQKLEGARSYGVAVKPSKSGHSYAEIDSAGNVVIGLGPHAQGEGDVIADEEVRHAADMLAAKDRWIAANPDAKRPFGMADFHAEKRQALDELRVSTEALRETNQQQYETITKAIQQSYEAYHKEPLFQGFVNGPTFWEDVTKFAVHQPLFLAELTRQLSQLKAGGTITEATPLWTAVKRIAEMVRQAVVKLTEMLQALPRLSPKLAQQVDEMTALAAEMERIGGEPKPVDQFAALQGDPFADAPGEVQPAGNVREVARRLENTAMRASGLAFGSASSGGASEAMADLDAAIADARRLLKDASLNEDDADNLRFLVSAATASADALRKSDVWLQGQSVQAPRRAAKRQTGFTVEKSARSVEVSIDGYEPGEATFVIDTADRMASSAARRIFPVVGEKDAVYRQRTILLPEAARGKGLGKWLLLKGYSLAPEAWYYNSQAWPDAHRTLQRLSDAGLIEFHKAGQADITEDAGAHVARITPAGVAWIKEHPSPPPAQDVLQAPRRIVPGDDQIDPDAAKPADAEPARRIDKARGFKESVLQRWAAKAKALAYSFTHTFAYIPNTAAFSSVRDWFVRLGTVPDTAKDMAGESVGRILHPLGPNGFKLFEAHSVAANLLASVDQGQPLRFGFQDRAQVATWLANLQALVAQYPSVQQAINARKPIVSAIAKRLVDRGMLPHEALQNAETYFHQQVLLYQQAKAYSDNADSGGLTAKPVKRAFQKARTTGVVSLSEDFDYNTSFVEAEVRWMYDAYVELEKADRLDELMATEDISTKVQQAAAAAGLQPNDDVADIVRQQFPGYVIWSPQAGSLFYSSFGLPQQVAEALERVGIDQMRLTDRELANMIHALNKRRWIIRAEVAQQLDNTKKAHDGPIASTITGAVAAWKAWTLFAPHRVVAYTLRNISGDVDSILAAGINIVGSDFRKELADAHRETVKLMRADDGRQPFAISPTMQKARRLGLVNSTVLNEVARPQDVKQLKRLFADNEFIGTKAWRAAWKGLVLPTEYFNTVSRVALWNYYRKQLAAGTLKHYGGARRRVVDALMKEQGADVAAAHLARNAVGDYGDITLAGQWLRKWGVAPFWSWLEINVKRVPLVLGNAARSGNLSLTGSVMVALAFARVGAMYGALWIINNLLQPEEERDLDKYSRQTAHLIMGRNADGSVNVFRNIGSLGDFGEWFGINELTNLMPLVKSGQVGAGDAILEALGQGLQKKLSGAAGPMLRLPTEILAGISFFPDPTEPRSTAQGWESVARTLGLGETYRELHGWFQKNGSRSRANAFSIPALLGFAVVRERDAALTDTYDLRERFLESKGKDTPASLHRRNEPQANMRWAIMAGDKEAFKEAATAWVAGIKKQEKETDAEHQARIAQSFSQMVARIDPLSGSIDKLDAEFTAWLTTDQRRRLDIARSWALELQPVMLEWFEEAKPQEARLALRSAVSRAARSRPERQEGETREKYQERLAEWDERRREAANLLKPLDSKQLASLLREAMKAQGLSVTPDTLNPRVQALARAIRAN